MLPNLGEYVVSIEQAQDTLSQLAHLRPARKADGQPYFSSGNFAVVFKMLDTQTGEPMALKCFLRDVPERKRRLQLVADYLKRYDTPYLLPLTYYENELWVDSTLTEQQEFDVMLMPWVEGQTLGQYVKTLCDRADRPALRQLTDRFDALARWLLAQPIAHGDLKPDNIMVRPDDQLVLVDYDGFFVPTLAGERATETGTPSYSHPRRTDANFDQHLDDFSLLVLGLELRTLAEFPNWQANYASGDSLLIRPDDYDAYSTSTLFKAINQKGTNSAKEWLIVMKTELLRLSPFIFTLAALLQKSYLSSYKKDNKYGFQSYLYAEVIPCIYEAINPFNEGLAGIKINNKWGFIDCLGREVIPAIYNYANSFSEGVAIVNKFNKYGIINSTGQEISPFFYDAIYRFEEGLAKVKRIDKYGFINRWGQEVIPCIYDSIEAFQSHIGLALVLKDNKNGFINKIGQEVISCIYDGADLFRAEDLALVYKGKKCGFINPLGQEVIPFVYDDSLGFTDELTPVKKDGKWGYINSLGLTITPYIYEYAGAFHNGLARVEKNGKKGLVNLSGKELSPCHYEIISEFREGMSQVSKIDKWSFTNKDKWGFIDSLGQEVIQCKYDGVSYFTSGLAMVYKDRKFGFINNIGRYIIPRIYEDADLFSEGLSSVKKNGKWGFLDSSGRLIIPFLYDDADSFITGRAKVRKGEKIGYIDKNGVEYWEK